MMIYFSKGFGCPMIVALSAGLWPTSAFCQQPTTLEGHTGAVFSVAFSPDGKRIVSGGVDETVKVWDVHSGQETLSLKGHTGIVWSVAFSPDGKRIVSAGGRVHKADEIKVWDAQRGRETLTLKGLDDLAASVAFSPDGTRIVGGGVAHGGESDDYPEAAFVKVWDSRSGEEILTLKGHTAPVWSVAFSPDGERIVSGAGGFLASAQGEVKVWDARSGRETLRITGIKDVQSVAFSPDGKRIVSGGGRASGSGKGPGELKVWDAQTSQEIFTLEGHTSRVMSVAFSPDGKRIVSGGGTFAGDIKGKPGNVKVWDTQSGQEIHTFKGYTRSVLSVAFSPDGKWIVSAGDEKTVRLWNTN